MLFTLCKWGTKHVEITDRTWICNVGYEIHIGAFDLDQITSETQDWVQNRNKGLATLQKTQLFQYIEYNLFEYILCEYAAELISSFFINSE